MRNNNSKALAHASSVAVAFATAITIPPAPAYAQALQPVVNVCTGIRLPRSAVTNIIGLVNQPIVDQIETTVNGITTVTLVLDPLANIPDLDIDLTTVLANAAAGDPITLQVVDTNGNVVTPSSDCNVSADGFALDDPAGLAIGGNQISGLGNGAAASAGTEDSIALGNGATTAAAAPGSVAIGDGASVTAGNSVALGTDSTATRGAQAGYTAPGVAGTVSSAGEVSVGAPGALRQITNVAAGSAPTDAATVGQVQGALDAVAALADDAVQYTDGTHTAVALDGAGGTTVSGVAAGELSATSTEAVNGSQLFATNQALAALEDSAVQYDDASQGTVTLGGAGGTRITNLTPGAIAATSTDAVNGSQLFATNQLVAGNTTAITNLQAQVDNVPVGYVSDADGTTPSATPTNTAAFLGAGAGVNGGPVRVTNVAAGTVSATSTDAINGSQLAATNTQVAANTATGAANAADIDDLQANAVQYDDASHGTVTLDGAGGTTLTGVADGALAAGSSDAVNGSQLAATNTRVTTIENNLAGSTVVAVQYSNPGTPTVSNGGVITNDVTLVGADMSAPVRVHNVAAGTAATDAANVGQLQAGLSSTLTTANAYTDSRIAGLMDDTAAGLAQVNFDLGELRRDAMAGVAGAMAFAGLPQTLDPSKSMVAGAVAHYRGETAFAMGFSSAFNDGGGVVKVGGSFDTHGNLGVTAGAGFSF